jgi:hypothetical protein
MIYVSSAQILYCSKNIKNNTMRKQLSEEPWGNGLIITTDKKMLPDSWDLTVKESKL